MKKFFSFSLCIVLLLILVAFGQTMQYPNVAVAQSTMTVTQGTVTRTPHVTPTSDSTTAPPNLPDLRIVRVDVGYEFGCLDFDSFGQFVTIANDGNLDAGSFLLYKNGTFKRVAGLAANATVRVFVHNRAHPILAVVDSANEVQEDDEFSVSYEFNNDYYDDSPPLTLTPPPPCTETPTAVPPTITMTPTPPPPGESADQYLPIIIEEGKP